MIRGDPFFSASWFVEAQGGLGLALRRENYIFENPRKVVYAVPGVGGMAVFGLGYRFGDRPADLRP